MNSKQMQQLLHQGSPEAWLTWQRLLSQQARSCWKAGPRNPLVCLWCHPRSHKVLPPQSLELSQRWEEEWSIHENLQKFLVSFLPAKLRIHTCHQQNDSSGRQEEPFSRCLSGMMPTLTYHPAILKQQESVISLNMNIVIQVLMHCTLFLVVMHQSPH